MEHRADFASWFLMAMVGAAWVATQAAADLRDLIELARKRLGMERKVLCGFAGLTEQNYADQINLRAPMNVFRLADVPGLLESLADVIQERRGNVVFPKDMVKLIVQVQHEPRPMLRVSSPAVEEVA